MRVIWCNAFCLMDAVSSLGRTIVVNSVVHQGSSFVVPLTCWSRTIACLADRMVMLRKSFSRAELDNAVAAALK